MTAPRMRKTPQPSKVSGAFQNTSGEQLSFLPRQLFCPILPPRGSAAEQALVDLLARDLTQLEWIQDGRGWRLAAAVKELDYLGWEPCSIRVKCNGWGRPIARYSLPAKAKQAATLMLRGANA